MSRRDTHFDAVLRQLGATYYQSLQGKGSPAAVARALESVAAADHVTGGAAPENGGTRRHARLPGYRWRVRDVMTTDVAIVSSGTSYHDVAALMSERKVTAVPVLDHGRRVIGIISEADLIRRQERRFSRAGTGLPRRRRRELAQARALTAARLMTTPPITIHPDAPLGAAARQLNGHRIRRMPVVDSDGRLLGIVSRRDLLRVFLRPDKDIAADVRAVITDILLEDPEQFSVTVHDGTVTLSGGPGDPETAAAAVRLAEDVDGVIRVIDRLAREPVGA
jgi:CBS domain-containing protein